MSDSPATSATLPTVDLEALHAEVQSLRALLAAERERFEHELRLLLRRLALWNAYSQEGQVWVNAEGRVCDVSGSVERLTGLPANSYLKQHLLDLAQPDDREAVAAAVAQVKTDPSQPVIIQGRFADPQGRLHWAEAILTNHLADDDVRALVIHFRDVTERRQSEEERRRALAFLEAMIDASPLGIITLDREARVTSWNRAAEEMFGWRADEILGQSYPLVPSGKEDEFRYLFERSLRGMAVHGLDLTRKRRDGSPIEISLYTVPLRDASGSITAVLSLFRDVTEEKRAARRLVESEKRYRTLVQRSPDLIFECLPDGTLSAVSPACQSVLGVPPREALGRTLADLIAPADADQVRRYFAQAAPPDNTEPQVCTATVFRPEGARTIEIRATPSWHDGTLRGWHGMARDITERQRTLEELRRSQRFIARVADAPPILIFVYDLAENRNVYNNAQVVKQLGYSMAELERPGFIFSLVHPDDVPALLALIERKRQASDADVFEHILRLRRADGEYRSYQAWEAVFERDAQGQPLQMLGVAVDVTERQRAEAAVREKQALIEALAAAVPDGLYVIDLERDRLVYGNRQIEAQLGWTVGELAMLDAVTYADLVHPEDQATWMEHRRRRANAAPGELLEIELRLRHRDGSWRWIRSRERVYDSGPAGPVRQIVGTARDVTSRRSMEIALRRSEARLRQLIENADDLFLLYDLDGRIQYGFAPARYGIDESQWLGKTPVELFDPPIGQMLMEQLQTVLRTQQAHVFENRLSWQGREYWFSDHVYPIRDPDGRVTGVGRICRDITIQKEAEAAAREKAHFSERIVSSSPALVFTIDVKTGHVGFVSGNVERLLGYSPSQLQQLGQNLIPRVTHPEERTLIANLLERWKDAADGEILEAEYRLRHADGRWRIFHSWATVFARDEAGRVTQILSNALDVTEQRLAEQERQRQQQLTREWEQRMAQAQKLESLGVLAGGIAHDFNNLLTAILGNTSLALMRPALGGDLTDLLQQIQLAAQRAAELTQQMLAYAGKGKASIQPLSLNHLIHEMTRLLRSVVSKQAVFQLELAPELPLVHADATQLRQIIMNLITNASDALEGKPGSIILHTDAVTLDAEALQHTLLPDSASPGRFVVVEVRDTGCGMDQATLRRIFDPFFTTKFTGRGLGLAAVLGIVRSHRGTLSVDSMVGVGTTFRLYLPASDQPAPRLDAVPAGRAAGNILIAIAERSIRDLTKRLLEKCGFHPLPVGTAREAAELSALGSQQVMLAVIDPEHLGQPLPELLKRLRSARPGLPIVLIQRGFHSGPQPPDDVVVIEKPFNPTTLVHAVKEALGEQPRGGTEATRHSTGPGRQETTS